MLKDVQPLTQPRWYDALRFLLLGSLHPDHDLPYATLAELRNEGLPDRPFHFIRFLKHQVCREDQLYVDEEGWARGEYADRWDGKDRQGGGGGKGLVGRRWGGGMRVGVGM